MLYMIVKYMDLLKDFLYYMRLFFRVERREDILSFLFIFFECGFGMEGKNKFFNFLLINIY